MQEAFGVCEMNFMVLGADFWGFLGLRPLLQNRLFGAWLG